MSEDELCEKWIVGEFIEKDVAELSELMKRVKGQSS